MTVKRANNLLRVGGSLAGLFVLLAILVAANVILSSVRVRADLTEEKLYSLSPGSKAVLKKMEKDVTLKFFFNSSSPEVPVQLKNYARKVQDLLKEYEIAGGGKVTVEHYDPKPDSEAEEWAQKYGLSGQQTAMFGPSFFLGLVAVAGATEGALPVLDPRQEELLEYSITRLIYRAAHPEKPVVGVMSGLPLMGSGGAPFAMPGQPQPPQTPPWMVIQDLKQDYTVREVPTDCDKIDTEINALVLVHPKELSDKTLYAIDQFVLRGGRLLALVDPVSIAELENSPRQPYQMQPTSSNLEKLFKAWGVGYDPGKAVADARALSRVRNQANQVEESPVWLSLRKEAMSKDDVVASGLESLLMPLAGSFLDNTGGALKFVPLIRTSTSAGLVSGFAAQFGGNAVRSEFAPGGVPLNLAVRLTGKFKTAFPEGAPKAESIDKDGNKKADSAAPQGEGLKEGESAAILVGDSDMVFDRFCAQEVNFFGYRAHQPLNDNLNFFANVVEQMAGSTDLISIRSRGRFERPFDRVIALQEDAARRWKEREKELEEKLQSAQRKLSELQAAKDQSQQFILSPEQKQAIAQFREDEINTKKQLKEVRKSLRRDIEVLGVKIKVLNIGLVPLLVCIAGVSFGLYRRR